MIKKHVLSPLPNNPAALDLVCFSHLGWDFVFQRPQHLLSRFAKYYRVFYIEETQYYAEADEYTITLSNEGVWIVRLFLADDGTSSFKLLKQKQMLDEVFTKMKIENYFFWFYTPMPLRYTSHFHPKSIIYDCMDELSNFKNPPPGLKGWETELFKKAGLVFTGGYSLYEAKQHLHKNIHPFPSSIDKEHFAIARNINNEPEDQAHIPHPRFGFYGVLDERFNMQLITEVAQRKPDWNIILIGPICKIEFEDIPVLPNIHYLGARSYKELPHYLSGWDVAIIPFELNDSTKFISPTKTPEYLAAGKPVISTSIKDVVRPYGHNALVHIADTADEFIAAGEQELHKKDKAEWLNKVDNFLCQNSWDKTFGNMLRLVEEQLNNKESFFRNYKKDKVYV